MTLHRLTQINLAIVAVLGTVLLGSAQGSYALPLLAIVSAAAATYWTDIRGRIRLNGAVANLAALIAVAVSVSEVVRADASEQLVAIANLLIYLQTILLFQEKTVRVGWQLLSLSLLQVVVAAAIGDSIFFGALAMLYLLCGLSAVSLLCCYGESLAHGAPFVPVGAKRKLVWGFHGDRSPSPDSGAVARVPVEPPKHFYRGLARCLAALAAGSMLVAGLLFVVVPRYGDAKLMTQNSQHSASMTGFSEQVDLNIGSRRIFENNEIVMRLRLVDDATGLDFAYYRDVYLRGAIAYKYDDGNWRHVQNEEYDEWSRRREIPPGVVRQIIEIEPMRHERLFSAYPVVTTYGDRRILTAPLRRHQGRQESRMALQIGTTAFYLGEQHSVTPCYETPSESWSRLPAPRMSPDEDQGTAGEESASGAASAEKAAEPTAGPLAGVIAFAKRAVADAEIDPGDRIGIARALEERLKLSGEFGYTLALPQRNALKDPIEDFVTEHRQGNCEFFASALALMLRSQGIPARIVSGYHSADWNPLGGYLQVRQLHAHAWVEAYLKPDQVPDAMKLPDHNYGNGAWLRLDPTPNDDSSALTDGNFGFWARMKNLFDHVDLLWRNYIIGFDRERQERLIYSPLEDAVDETRWGIARTGVLLATALGAVVNAIGWVGVAACIVAVWLAANAIARRWPARLRLAWLARLGGWFAPPRWRRNAANRSAPRVAFYERFERIAARAGFRREPQQTPLEFAQAVGGQLFDMPESRIAARAPRQVVEAFYRVRYGGHALAEEEAAVVECALVELERVLSWGGTGAARAGA